MNLFFYGDDPQGATGYSIQAKNILTRLAKHFNIACLAINRADENPQEPFNNSNRLPFKIYRANVQGIPEDPAGTRLLRSVFARMNAEVLFVMGDLWSFKGWFSSWLETMQFRKNFKTIGYFSTEYPISAEEEYILKLVDFPITHSRWGMGYKNKGGYEAIKEKVPHMIYIPDSVDQRIFYPLTEEQRATLRLSVGIKPSDFVIACVNRNSIRKDISALVRVFKRVKKEINDAKLYLHCLPYDPYSYHGKSGSVNLLTLCQGLELGVGQDVIFPTNFTPHHGYPQDVLNGIYNTSDLIVSTSVSEGFGTTPVEALFTGKPILIPGHTGFSNIVETCGIDPVRSYSELWPLVTAIPVHPIDEDDLTNRIIDAYEKKDNVKYKLQTEKQAMKAVENFDSDKVFERHWMPLVDNLKKRASTRKKEVLFIQHSSAGDIFITVGCLKGIKKKHPKMKINYMTQQQYHDIVTNHPLVDNVLDYQPSLLHEYEIVYFPHEKFIFRGNWNANDVPLGKLYACLCDVEFETPKIDLVEPKISLPEEYIVVHCQSHPYRSYWNFHIALNDSKIPVVQIGSSSDQILGNGSFEFIDARGLTYRESSYIISKAKGFVGIDSFPAHVAGSFNIPMVIVFGCGASRATAPITQGIIMKIEPDYAKTCPVLGPCSGNYNCPNPCGPRQNPILVRKAIKEIFPDIFPDVEKMLKELICS